MSSRTRRDVERSKNVLDGRGSIPYIEIEMNTNHYTLRSATLIGSCFSSSNIDGRRVWCHVLRNADGTSVSLHHESDLPVLTTKTVVVETHTNGHRVAYGRTYDGRTIEVRIPTGGCVGMAEVYVEYSDVPGLMEYQGTWGGSGLFYQYQGRHPINVTHEALC